MTSDHGRAGSAPGLAARRSGWVVSVAGVISVMLGAAVLAGWILGRSGHALPADDGAPMAPVSAVNFILAGLMLLAQAPARRDALRGASRIAALAIIALAGAQILGYQLRPQAGGDGTGVPGLFEIAARYRPSPMTMGAFLLFALGSIADAVRNRLLGNALTRSIGALLAVAGAEIAVALALDLREMHGPFFAIAGLGWMALSTAIGIGVLGAGLWQVAAVREAARADGDLADSSRGIMVAAGISVGVATLITAAVGSLILSRAVEQQARDTLVQLRDAKIALVDTIIAQRRERAQIAATDPELAVAAGAATPAGARLLHAVALERLARQLVLQGMTGVGLQIDDRVHPLAGTLLGADGVGAALAGQPAATLAWDGNYVLRVAVAVPAPGGTPARRLVLEQQVAAIDAIVDQSNSWGLSGTMALCARGNARELLCFPQREQRTLYVIADTFDGQPLPMTRALEHESGTGAMLDYRGHDVLAAYGPIGSTGLGLVLRMDLAEIYAPLKKDVLAALPLIILLGALGIRVMRERVRPLVGKLVTAYAAERDARNRFDAAMQSGPDAFLIYQAVPGPDGTLADFRCVYANQNAAQAATLPRPTVLDPASAVPAAERQDLFARFCSALLSGATSVEELAVTQSGQARWILRQIVAMPGGVAVTIRDITRNKRLVLDLELANRLRSAIVESAAYAVIATDTAGTIISFNAAAERMLWYRAADVIGKANPVMFHLPDEIGARAEALSHELGVAVAPGFDVFTAKAKLELNEQREWTFVRRDGMRLQVRLSVTALRDRDGQLLGFLGIAHDISEQKRAEEYIRHIALHDALTGLPNRLLLDDRVKLAIAQHDRRGGSFVLAMMDIDRFKRINDSLGHHVGDRLLKAFVERVRSCLRPADTFARMGGDEFVLLLPECDEAEAQRVIARAVEALAPPIGIGNQELHVTASIGISVFPRDGTDLHELLRCADVAMYWVKAHGRNASRVYSREVDTSGTERLRLDRELHLALADSGFELFYQPKLDLATRAIVGVEALLRMRRMDGTWESPAGFIPLAEENGLIVPIGKWVLETACRDAITLQQELGSAISMAVNISPRQFLDPELAATVRATLAHSGLPPARLELELTESVLMDERRGVIDALFELHALGVRIAIDDFGTGYSALSYLKRFPIRTLKIDQTFIRDVTSDGADAALVGAIIAMGHGMNIALVAEGVETPGQLAFLAQRNCDLCQGFHIARPMPLDELLPWLRQHARRWEPALHGASG